LISIFSDRITIVVKINEPLIHAAFQSCLACQKKQILRVKMLI